ncbi:MAG: hypothetical protein HUJ73_03125, partial [Eubacterium sp.]|nr:hypothetical protein [Eubacterium sp.]
LDILGLTTLSAIGTTIIAYIPNIIAAALIAFLAWVLAEKAAEAILRANSSSEGFATLVRVLIYTIAAFMALTQLGIAADIVRILFTAIVISLAVAFAIAFGVGGRFWAGKKLEELDIKFKKEIEKVTKRIDSDKKDAEEGDEEKSEIAEEKSEVAEKKEEDIKEN